MKAPPQRAPVAVVGGTVHTISGATHSPGYVLFDKGVIVAVGEASAMPALPPGTEVVDAAGRHVYPGLIGAYTQLGLVEIRAVRASADMTEVGSGGVSPEVRACVAVNPDSTLLPVTRSNGVLAAGVFPTGGSIPGRASVMTLDGWTWEDMTVLPETGLVVNWPFSRPVTAWWMDTPEEEQLRNIRQGHQRIEEAFVTARAYARARAADPSLPADARWEAMRAVFPGDAAAGEKPAAHMPVFILAQDYDQIVSAVEFAGRFALRCVIVGGRESLLAADLLKRRDVPVVLLGTHSMPRRDDSPFDEPFTLPAQLQEAGVRWCLASGEETPHERNLPYNAGRAVAYGLSHAAAVRSVTLAAAEILGVGDRLGSLDAGKSATLIVTDGSPLELTTRIHAAYIDGKQIDLSNKQTELERKYREKYRQAQGETGSEGTR